MSLSVLWCRCHRIQGPASMKRLAAMKREAAPMKFARRKGKKASGYPRGQRPEDMFEAHVETHSSAECAWSAEVVTGKIRTWAKRSVENKTVKVKQVRKRTKPTASPGTPRHPGQAGGSGGCRVCTCGSSFRSCW